MAVLRMGGMHPSGVVRIILFMLTTMVVYYFTARFSHLVSSSRKREVRMEAHTQSSVLKSRTNYKYSPPFRHEISHHLAVPPIRVAAGSGNRTDPKAFNTRNIHRIVHLDLKGAPPKLEYLRKIIPRLREWGATGLLLEYEDMFPYWGDLKVLARPNAYNTSTIAEILRLAETHELKVIPLIQTFGHFEFVLKHDQFKHIRERKDKDKNLNPAHEDSFRVVSQMIDQLMSLHPKIQQLHVGCDEVYYLGHSKESAQMMREKFYDGKGLFLHHVSKVLNHVHSKYPKVKALMWDDMIRKIDTYRLKQYNFGSLVEPMVWLYVTSVDKHFPSSFWANYADIFKSVWTASAFKGATGRDQYVVDIDYHLRNQKNWIKVMEKTHKKHYPKLAFKGIVLTGWQRYDHHLPLCELLPVGIPSLVSCLHCLTFAGFPPRVHKMVSQVLQCKMDLNLSPAVSLESHAKCTFPGSSIYDAVSELKITRHHIQNYINRRVRDDKTKDILRRRVLLHVRTLPDILTEALDQDAVVEFMQHQVVQGVNRLADIRREAQSTLYELYPWMRPKGQI